MSQASVVGAGIVTLSSSGSYNDIPDEIVSNAVGQGQDLPNPPDKDNNITVSIETIIMSALIFIGILSWFEFLRVWYDNVFTINGEHHNFSIIYNRLWYAIFITALVLILVYVVYRIANRP